MAFENVLYIPMICISIDSFLNDKTLSFLSSLSIIITITIAATFQTIKINLKYDSNDKFARRFTNTEWFTNILLRTTSALIMS